MTYNRLVVRHQESICYYFTTIIDNKTMDVSYSIRCNLHVDYGITNNFHSHYFGTNRNKFRRLLRRYKSLAGLKLQIYNTDNDVNFTRIIYKLSK